MYDDLKQELNILRSPSVGFSEPLRLYHYCDSVGLLGIFDSQKLWATHTFYLNDTTEINYTHELIEQIYHELIKKAPLDENQEGNNDHQLSYRGLLHRLSYKTMRPKPNNDIFVICFCKQKDLLSQWRGYGNKGSGYAVGFKTSKLKSIDSKFSLHKILYSEEEQKIILRKMIDAVISSFKKSIIGTNSKEQERIAEEHIVIFEGEIVSLATYFKHPSFSEEEEWRLVYDKGKDSSLKEIKFRANKNGIIPYVEFESRNKIQKLPIVKVLLGPTAKEETAKKSIKMMVGSLYPELIVEGSKIPLR